jgi:hypothetical protein
LKQRRLTLPAAPSAAWWRRRWSTASFEAPYGLVGRSLVDQGGDLVAGPRQVHDDGAADESPGAGDQHPHAQRPG